MISSFLHRVVEQRAAEILMGLRDQGKVAKPLANDQYGNGSCWTHTGLNIRFKDWRFIHKARLKLRDRHNKIIDRLLHNICFGQVNTDQAVAAANSRLRP